MPMTTNDIITLLPIIIVTTTAVIVMLTITVVRHHLLSVALTVAGLMLAIYATQQSGEPAVQVTPLLVFDKASDFFGILVLLTSIAVAIFCHGYFDKREGLQEELYILLLTATLGAQVIVSSNHFVSFFIGLELLGISLSALVAYPVTNLNKSSLPIEAAVKYLILSGVAAGFLAFGMALIYAASGSMSLQGIATSFSSSGIPPLAITGIVMMFAGIAFKLSLVPFHMWTPDVYHGAPSPITAFVATISKAAVLVFMLRTFTTLNAYQYEAVIYSIALIAIASMLVGNILALMQANVKRFLAYSSIAHLGYVMVAFLAVGAVDNNTSSGVAANVASNVLAVEAVSYYIVAYVITTLTGFGVVSLLSSRVASERDMDGLYDYQGLFWTHPGLAAALTASLLSLAGIPLTIGFIGKFYVLAAGVQTAMWGMLFFLVVASGIGLFYYLRLIIIMASNPDSEREDSSYNALIAVNGGLSDGSLPSLGVGVIALLTILILLFGIYPSPLIQSINAFASTFI